MGLLQMVASASSPRFRYWVDGRRIAPTIHSNYLIGLTPHTTATPTDHRSTPLRWALELQHTHVSPSSHSMATMLNVSSVILRGYPDTSPWDLTPTVSGIHLPDISSYSQPLPEALRRAALSQALKTGLNPLHFIFGNNPFVLDDPVLDHTPLLLDSAPLGVSPLARFACPPSQAVLFVKVLWTEGACVVSRVRVGSATRALKLVRPIRFTACLHLRHRLD